MKRLTVLIACVATVALLLSGCATGNGPTRLEYETLSKITGSIEYEGCEITLEHLYAREVENNFEYTLYVVAEYDISKVDEKTLHYMDDDLTFYLSCDKESADIDVFDTPFKQVVQDGKMYQLFYYPRVTDPVRESFIDSEIGISIWGYAEDSGEFTNIMGVLDKFTPLDKFEALLVPFGFTSLE